MGSLFRKLSELTEDKAITVAEVAEIRDYIREDGQLDLDDVKFLVQLLVDAKEVCPEFDELFFPALRDVILQDGEIGADEQFYLLKMIYADGRVRESELEFLEGLRKDVKKASPEFEALCDEAFAAHSTSWQVGGN